MMSTSVFEMFLLYLSKMIIFNTVYKIKLLRFIFIL